MKTLDKVKKLSKFQANEYDAYQKLRHTMSRVEIEAYIAWSAKDEYDGLIIIDDDVMLYKEKVMKLFVSNDVPVHIVEDDPDIFKLIRYAASKHYSISKSKADGKKALKISAK